MEKLNNNFLIELAKLCIVSKDSVDVIRQHLSYSFIKGEEYKEIFKYIFDYHSSTGRSPTVGTLSQNLPETPIIINLIGQIQQTDIHDRKIDLLQTFEGFIRKGRFIKLWEEIKELYPKDSDEAMKQMEKETKSINEFCLTSKVHSRVFADFPKREQERRAKDHHVIKYPVGIPPLDHHLYGGVELGRALLVIARKGVGKSTLLRWIGYNFAFRGYSGVHFQAEGTKEEVESLYDSMWTAVAIEDIKKGELGSVNADRIEKSRQALLAQRGEIIVIPYEQFLQASIADCRNHIIELMKIYDIKWAVFDYLEKFEPGDGKRYNTGEDGVRSKKEAVAEKIVNIATEFKIFCATATQANNIEKKDYNNPNFEITRENISNLKATINPFAYTITLNQTDDENDRDIIRIHEEGFRFQKILSWESTYHIVQNRDIGRFINIEETNKRFWDPVRKRVIKNAPQK